MNYRHEEIKIYYYSASISIEEQKGISQSLFSSPHKIHHSVGSSTQVDFDIQLHVTTVMQQLSLCIDLFRLIA